MEITNEQLESFITNVVNNKHFDKQERLNRIERYRNELSLTDVQLKSLNDAEGLIQ